MRSLSDPTVLSSKGRSVSEVLAMATGASTAVAGESAEAGGNTGLEEVVTGNIPVSQGAEVVEQGVQVEQSTPDEAGSQQGYQDEYPNRQDQPRHQQA
jgi:hypothetical protein